MKNVIRQGFVVAIGATVLLLSSCSSTTKPVGSDTTEKAAEPSGPPQPVTAKTALWPMYTSARSWSTDCVIVKYTRKELTGVPNEGGSAGLWEATFVSPSRGQYRVYSYAVAGNPPAPYKGVSTSAALPWSGFTRDVMPIQVSEMHVDSDAVYTAAQADAAAWLKKHADKPLNTFQLGEAYQFGTPVWLLMWGDNKNGYRVFVSAADGKVMNKK